MGEKPILKADGVQSQWLIVSNQNGAVGMERWKRLKWGIRFEKSWF